MKFLIDAQLPQSLTVFLKNKGFDTLHTLDLPEKNRTKDFEIAKKANDENRAVITKDIDFLELFLLKSVPRKLVMVKTGNISNKELINLFDGYLDIII